MLLRQFDGHRLMRMDLSRNVISTVWIQIFLQCIHWNLSFTQFLSHCSGWKRYFAVDFTIGSHLPLIRVSTPLLVVRFSRKKSFSNRHFALNGLDQQIDVESWFGVICPSLTDLR